MLQVVLSGEPRFAIFHPATFSLTSRQGGTESRVTGKVPSIDQKHVAVNNLDVETELLDSFGEVRDEQV
jgi:hypothetical protein